MSRVRWWLRGWGRSSWLTAELVRWLQAPADPGLAGRLAGWDREAWLEMRRVILMQGVAPTLHATLPSTALYAHIPASLQAWLAEQYAMNRLRVERMQAELAAILQAAALVGIPVMPLKGCSLAAQVYPSPWWRPMADLDLLVRPADAGGMARILQELGYVYDAADSNEHANHTVYMNPNARVVSVHGEHPDNPRPVELHVGLQKGVWGDIVSCDLTERMWREAQQTTLLGAPAMVPAMPALLEFAAFHATWHLLFQAGRLIQWLDLALISNRVTPFAPQHPEWLFPALRLSQRAWPRQFELDLAWLAPLAPRRVTAWAERAPLDGRCGLTLGPPPHLTRRYRLHWRRWWPTPWRLRLGYYRWPLPLAYGRHLVSWARRVRVKVQARWLPAQAPLPGPSE